MQRKCRRGSCPVVGPTSDSRACISHLPFRNSFIKVQQRAGEPLTKRICAARQAQQRTLAALKAPWAQWADDLQTLLDSARDKKAFNGTKLKKNNYDGWLQTLAAWRDDPALVSPGDAAWFLGRVRALCEAPHALLAA